MSTSIRAGRSPTFWTRGLALLGLAGTRGLASPIEELLSTVSNSVQVSLTSPLKWNRTRESGLDPRVQVNSSNIYIWAHHQFLSVMIIHCNYNLLLVSNHLITVTIIMHIRSTNENTPAMTCK